jgi:hypothetical protein
LNKFDHEVKNVGGTWRIIWRREKHAIISFGDTPLKREALCWKRGGITYREGMRKGCREIGQRGVEDTSNLSRMGDL